MKGITSATAFLLSIVSALAAPAPAPEAAEAAAPLEERSSLWNPGYKPYKYKIYAPGKPAHDKYLTEKPAPQGYPSYLGYGSPSQQDYQYYLYPGNGNSYGYGEYTGGTSPNPKYKDIVLTGPPGYYQISPVYNPPSYQYPQGWGYQYKQWYITPIYKILAWIEITLSYFKQVHYWQPPQGYKWIGYDDGKGGYDVKAWDGKYEIVQVYFEIQIVVEAQYKSWGFPWL